MLTLQIIKVGLNHGKKNEGGFKDIVQNGKACLLAILKQELLDFQILGFCSRCFHKNLDEEMVLKRERDKANRFQEIYNGHFEIEERSKVL